MAICRRGTSRRLVTKSEPLQDTIRAIRATVVNEHQYVWRSRGQAHARRGEWDAAYRSFRRLWIYGPRPAAPCWLPSPRWPPRIGNGIARPAKAFWKSSNKSMSQTSSRPRHGRPLSFPSCRKSIRCDSVSQNEPSNSSPPISRVCGLMVLSCIETVNFKDALSPLDKAAASDVDSVNDSVAVQAMTLKCAGKSAEARATLDGVDSLLTCRQPADAPLSKSPHRRSSEPGKIRSPLDSSMMKRARCSVEVHKRGRRRPSHESPRIAKLRTDNFWTVIALRRKSPSIRLRDASSTGTNARAHNPLHVSAKSTCSSRKMRPLTRGRSPPLRPVSSTVDRVHSASLHRASTHGADADDRW